MWVLFVSLPVFVQLLLLSVRHFRTRSPFRTSFRILAYIYLGFCLWMLINSLIYLVSFSPLLFLRHYVLPIDTALLYCLNPLIYFFYRKLHGNSIECLWRRVLPHFIFPLLTLIVLPLYGFSSASLSRQVLVTNLYNPNLLPTLFHWGFCLQSIVYVSYLHLCISKQKSVNYLVIRGHQSISLRQFRVVLFVGLGIVLLHGGFFHLGLSSMKHHQEFRLMTANILGMLLICLSMSDTGSSTHIHPQPDATEPMIRKMLVTEAEKTRILLSLRQLMETEKLYLQPDCHLDLLATRLNTNKSILSYVLNYDEEGGCIDFVHQYRIDHALELIHQKVYLQHTVEIIASDSGYASVATFRREFKKRQGITPGEYIAQHKLRGVGSDDV